MRFLLLGGTGFVGYHTARSALEAGHEVWLFNRGRTRSEALPEAKRLIGDRRANDLDALQGVDELDAVIDFTGYFPAEIEAAGSLLRTKTKRYVFISSVSVYADPFPRGGDEHAPLSQLPAGADASQITGDTYGPLKVACEEKTRELFGDRATVVRPTLIVGPEDPTDRFTYWVRRGLEGGRIVAPGEPGRPVQFIDGRDLASWLLTLCANDTAGTFNACSDPTPLSAVLDAAIAETADAEVVWRSDDELLAAGIQPWMDLPLWIPGEEGESAMTASNAAAVAAGLTMRPLETTVADTRAWDRARGLPELRAGIPRARQDELARD